MELRREEKTKQPSRSLYSYMIHHDRKILHEANRVFDASNKQNNSGGGSGQQQARSDTEGERQTTWM